MAPFTENTSVVNSPAKKPAAKKGFLGRFSSGRRNSKSSIPSAKEAIIRQYTAAFFGSDDDLTQYFTEDATFSPPGATLPIAAVGGMMKAMATSFPDWQSVVVKVEEQPDGTCKAYTQQRIGVMKADLPAIGPFPAVKLADASARIRAVPTILPVEVGIVTFDTSGIKVASVDYSAATIGETLDATTMDLTSPVGFPCLFELMGVALPAPTPELPASPSPCFYTVVHTFVDGQAEGWWAAISSMGEADRATMTEKFHALGFHNHSFIPTSPTGEINCLWECKAETTLDEFQRFIDGPDGPGPGVFVNQAFKVMPGAVLPTSHFHAPAPAPTMPSTGSFFWVYHSFKEGAAEGFWKMLGGMQPEDFAQMTANHHSLGFHNHSFAPCGEEGPCICIWESKEPTSVATFQQFIDGPAGPGAGAIFDNTVHLAMDGATLPPAFFPSPSVVQHRINRIPIVAGSMAEIVKVANSGAFEEQLAGFSGLISVDVLAVDDVTMMSHSRWESEAYAHAAAAALGKVLGGALKQFVTGPPSPVYGVAAWTLSGRASRGAGSVPVTVRLTTLALKEGGLGEVLSTVRAREAELEAIDGLVSCSALRVGESTLLVAAEYVSMGALEAAAPKVGDMLKALGPHLLAPPDVIAGTIAWSHDVAAAAAQALRQSNIVRVQELVGEFMAGRPEAYMAGVADGITGSVLGGLIPGGERVSNKAEFGALMGKMEEFMEVRKFEPCNWRAVGDDVLFNVEWEFMWRTTGEVVQTTALVRKVVQDGQICEKYHMISPELVTRLTGNAPPHGTATVERVQALLAEYGAGNPEGYLAGVAEDIRADVLGGLIPGADRVSNKAEFGALMGRMDEFMEVRKFEPCNFCEMPNDDMIFNVNWSFVWKATGATVDTTAIVRKVVKDGQICEKYHMMDVTCIEPPPTALAAASAECCIVCPPCDMDPDKCFGPPGAQAMMWVTKMAGGRQAQRIKVEPGFDWRAVVKPMLPGCPDWCPATHFGYLESGIMGVRFADGTEKTIHAGETYLIPPGHLPIVENEPAVMVEFSQDTTYTQLSNK